MGGALVDETHQRTIERLQEGHGVFSVGGENALVVVGNQVEKRLRHGGAAVLYGGDESQLKTQGIIKNMAAFRIILGGPADNVPLLRNRIPVFEEGKGGGNLHQPFNRICGKLNVALYSLRKL